MMTLRMVMERQRNVMNENADSFVRQGIYAGKGKACIFSFEWLLLPLLNETLELDG